MRIRKQLSLFLLVSTIILSCNRKKTLTKNNPNCIIDNYSLNIQPNKLINDTFCLTEMYDFDTFSIYSPYYLLSEIEKKENCSFKESHLKAVPENKSLLVFTKNNQKIYTTIDRSFIDFSVVNSLLNKKKNESCFKILKTNPILLDTLK